MRYVAVLLAVFVVATAAAAQNWSAAESAAPGPIELRPSEQPAETAATLLDLKPAPTTSTGATVAAPAAQHTATQRTATQRTTTQRTATQRTATQGAATPPVLAPSQPRAQAARSVGAAPAPAAAPIPIQQTRDEDGDGGDDDDNDDDDDDGDSGGDDD